MLSPRSRAVLAGMYLAAVILLTFAADSDSSLAYWVRALILFPVSLPLLLIDYWGGVLLFGPDPKGPGAIVFFYAAATGAGLLQLFAVRSVLDERDRRPRRQ